MAADGDDQVHARSGAINGPTPRGRLTKAMNAVIKQRQMGHVFYTQDSRRMTIVRLHLVPPFGTVNIYEDCSSGVTGLYFMAGLHDPNELRFNGSGYTGTLVRNGERVSSGYKIGDLVFYGPAMSPSHVACVYGNGKVWSHGHPGGPVVVPIDYRGDRSSVRRYFP